jgi:F0F1-type ATP synthase membrane subunit b/b'
MDQGTLLVIMASFTGIAAIALLMQAGLLWAIYKTSRSMQETVARLSPKIEALAESSRLTLEESRKRIAEVSEKATAILDTTRQQLARVEEVLNDASQRTQRQLENAEALVEDAMARARETVELVHKGVLWPLREINGVAAGLRAALLFLMRGVRPNPDRLTADEEMFI